MFHTLRRPHVLVVTLAAAGILMLTMGVRESFGLFVFAPLLQKLIQSIGWMGAMWAWRCLRCRWSVGSRRPLTHLQAAIASSTAATIKTNTMIR